jgi:hypothetical protein
MAGGAVARAKVANRVSAHATHETCSRSVAAFFGRACRCLPFARPTKALRRLFAPIKLQRDERGLALDETREAVDFRRFIRACGYGSGQGDVGGRC